MAWHSASSPRPAGVIDAVINAAPDVAIDNMFSIGSVFGTNAKKTEKFVEMTASELKALSLWSRRAPFAGRPCLGLPGGAPSCMPALLRGPLRQHAAQNGCPQAHAVRRQSAV